MPTLFNIFAPEIYKYDEDDSGIHRNLEAARTDPA